MTNALMLLNLICPALPRKAEEKTAENKAENDIDAEKNSLNQSKIEGADGNIDSKSGLKTDTSELSANTDKNNEDAAAGGEAYTSSSAFAKQPENEARFLKMMSTQYLTAHFLSEILALRVYRFIQV